MRTILLAFSVVLVACGSNGLDASRGSSSPSSSSSPSNSSTPSSSSSPVDAGDARFPCGNTTCDGRSEYCTISYVCVIFSPDMDRGPDYGCQPLPQTCVDKKDPCSCLCNELQCIDPYTGPPSGPSLDAASLQHACVIDENCV